MSKTSPRTYIVRQIHLAATLYRQHLVGKRYLYVFDNRYIEVLFKAQNFRHLTGVDTTLDALQFYRYAARGRLHEQQIYFSRRHPYDLCLRKIRNICNLAQMMTSESLILEEVVTNTRTYTFGTTDLTCTLCLDRETGVDGTPIGDCYIATSLRSGDNIDKSRHVYSVTHIFSRANTTRKYDTLCYMDSTASMADLPDNIRVMIDLSDP